ncbi:hypothetical protein AB8U03_01620 [Clostridium sp. Mt-5]|uniref:Uncharacterized protein n=1 Tax=Clostridium moutaii TaxID=3240932 RepID=A0ABV4BJD1_9CLOT
MYIFQVISFVIEIAFGLLVGGIIAFFPNIIFNVNKNYRPPKYEFYEPKSSRKSRIKVLKILGKSIWVIIIMIITIGVLGSYFLDIPKLIKGELCYITGNVSRIENVRKDIHEYVYIGDKQLIFSFISDVEVGKKYKIGYLTNTSRAIYVETLKNNASSKGIKGKFPYGYIMLFIGFMGIWILLVGLAPYLKFKLIIIASIVFYPANILLYIKEGLKSGLWFSFHNDGLSILTLGIVFAVVLWISYIMERKEDPETPETLIGVQLMGVSEIVFLIETFQLLLQK